jgi:hypothetical protein
MVTDLSTGDSGQRVDVPALPSTRDVQVLVDQRPGTARALPWRLCWSTMSGSHLDGLAEWTSGRGAPAP